MEIPLNKSEHNPNIFKWRVRFFYLVHPASVCPPSESLFGDERVNPGGQDGGLWLRRNSGTRAFEF